MRNPRRRQVTIRDVAMLCGFRPKRCDPWRLLPREFTACWAPVLVSHPTREDGLRSGRHHAVLAQTGVDKVKGNSRNKQVSEELLPGIDYT
eukprot:5085680-Pyramimonas_sp.AAC.1